MSDVIETAGTGRAKCRQCQEKIEKGALRFGEKVPNPFGEGESTHWFHLACAAEKKPDKLHAALQSFSGELPNRAELEQIAAEGAKNPKLAAIVRAEHAPSGRAACQHCHEKIGKGELRVAFEREAEPAGMAANAYVHLKCARDFFGADGLATKLERMTPDLSGDDRNEIEAALG
jgi:hypothetical protein